MNSTNLLAWLICLILAFFACILTVRNAGKTVSLNKEVQKLQEKIDSFETNRHEIQVQRIHESLKNIQDELNSLKQTAAQNDDAALNEKIDRLEELITTLEKNLSGLH
jgi:cob(I)alamin adenosyltransferase